MLGNKRKAPKQYDKAENEGKDDYKFLNQIKTIVTQMMKAKKVIKVTLIHRL